MRRAIQIAPLKGAIRVREARRGVGEVQDEVTGQERPGAQGVIAEEGDDLQDSRAGWGRRPEAGSGFEADQHSRPIQTRPEHDPEFLPSAPQAR